MGEGEGGFRQGMMGRLLPCHMRMAYDPECSCQTLSGSGNGSLVGGGVGGGAHHPNQRFFLLCSKDKIFHLSVSLLLSHS